MTTSIPDLSIQILNYESLFKRLQAGRTLITGNSRLSRVLTGQYSQGRLNRGDNQWQTPAEKRASMTWAKRLKRVFDIDIA